MIALARCIGLNGLVESFYRWAKKTTWQTINMIEPINGEQDFYPAMIPKIKDGICMRFENASILRRRCSGLTTCTYTSFGDRKPIILVKACDS